MNNHFTANWKQAFASRSFTIQFGLIVSALLFLAFFINWFFQHIETVAGLAHTDSLLNMIQPRDMSIAIFVLIYLGIIISVVYMSTLPYLLLKAMLAYLLLNLMRVGTLYLFPLEPDVAIIPLKDPIIELFFYSDRVIVKDLFFSGHVSMLVILAIVMKNVAIKYFLYATALVVAALLLIQHVHYTMDVVAAPVFSWISVNMADKISVKAP
jgi:hypothetical protein